MWDTCKTRYTTIIDDAYSLVAGDKVTLKIASGTMQFADANAGTHKIRIKNKDGFTLTGDDAGNYEIAIKGYSIKYPIPSHTPT